MNRRPLEILVPIAALFGLLLALAPVRGLALAESIDTGGRPDQTVVDLYVSETVAAPRRAVFGPDTTSVWVTFAYTGLSHTTVEIVLTSPTGLPLFSREADLTGAGSEQWAISGDAMARRAADQLAASAEAARANAQLAANQTRGTAEYLAVVTYAVQQMTSAVDILSQLELEEGRDDLESAVDATAELRELVAEANDLPPGEIDGRRLLAARMVEPAGRAVTAGESVAVAVEATTGLKIPLTRSAMAENDAYTVTARIDGRPGRTTSFWVYPGKIYLPWSQRR